MSFKFLVAKGALTNSLWCDTEGSAIADAKSYAANHPNFTVNVFKLVATVTSEVAAPVVKKLED